MDEDFLKEVAAQLRKPTGELGTEIATRMNEGNFEMNMGTINALEINDKDHVVEIGMGNGYFVQEILGRATKVSYTGCDYSKDMVDAATQLNTDLVEKEHAAFIHCNADSLPLGDHSVDTLFTVNTMYFWEDPGAVLKEFGRVLRPDGLLVITIRPGHAMKNYPTTKYNFEYFEREDVVLILEANGFRVIKSIQVTETKKVEVFGESFDAEYLIVVAHPN